MYYSVIQFLASEGGTISIAKDTWLTPRKTEVYWPPTKQNKSFNKILENGVSPDTSKWKLYGVQRVFYETDDLEKAKKKLKLAEDTSDMQSQAEDNIPKVRNKKKNPRYISSSSEDDNDDHVRPPPLKKKYEINARTFKQNNTEDQVKEFLLNETTLNLDFDSSELRVLEKETDPADIVPNSPHQLDFEWDSVLASPSGVCKLSVLEKETADIVQNSPRQSLIKDSVSASPSGVGKLTGFQDKVLSLLSMIKAQNDQILNKLNKTKIRVALKPEFQFPLKTLEELNANELLLKNQENYLNVVSYIETLGGRNTSNTVSRVLKLLIADCLAKEFNFYGKRSQKRPFGELLLRNCVVDAVKNTTGATQKEIDDNIKIWLKHAPERVKKLIR